MADGTMPAPPASTWDVTSQPEWTELTPGSGPVAGWRVMFTTGMGHTGTVFVPNAQYTPDNVRRMIAEKAATMDQIGSLSSSGS